MKKIIVLLFVVLFTSACSDAGPTNAPTIEREKFTQLLLDIRLVEAMYSVNYRIIDENDGELAPYFLTVFKKHGVSREAFAQSYEAYLREAETLLAIEKEVGERLAKMQAETLSSQ
jgi:hypothetical protein